MYNPLYPYPNLGAQQGWQCPVCHKVNAPWMIQCPCPGGASQQWAPNTSAVPNVWPTTITGVVPLNEEGSE